MSESSGVDAAFGRSRERFESVVGFLHGSQAAGLTHSELETRLSVDAWELIRVLYQDHMDLRTAREVRLPALTDAAGICRGAVERAHRRPLQTDGVRRGERRSPCLPSLRRSQPASS